MTDRPQAIALAVAGAAGRTGRLVLEAAADDPRFTIAAAITRPDCEWRGRSIEIGARSDKHVTFTDDLPESTKCDVLIDFTSGGGTAAWLDRCVRRSLPMVIAATGHGEDELNSIREAARRIPILKAANFSVGINLVLAVLGEIASQLGEAYDCEIIETHHNRKLDAPSGTALALLDELLAASGRTRDEAVVYGRSGVVGERPKAQIGVHAVRMGDLASRHEVHFAGAGEMLTLAHTAHTRAPFAAGALRAAGWLVSRPAGLYGMGDVLGRRG